MKSNNPSVEQTSLAQNEEPKIFVTAEDMAQIVEYHMRNSYKTFTTPGAVTKTEPHKPYSPKWKFAADELITANPDEEPTLQWNWDTWHCQTLYKNAREYANGKYQVGTYEQIRKQAEACEGNDGVIDTVKAALIQKQRERAQQEASPEGDDSYFSEFAITGSMMTDDEYIEHSNRIRAAGFRSITAQAKLEQYEREGREENVEY